MPIVGKGPAPYGFRWKGGVLEIEPAEAEIRRRAFELFKEFKSKGSVARKLNEAGVLTRRGGRWSDMQVGRILACTSAIGHYVFNKTTGKGTLSRTNTSEGDRVHVTCEPIVPQVLWDDVMALLELKANSPALVDSVVHPLVGIAYCECGEKLKVPSSNPKYVCPACQRKIPLDDLEGAVLEELSEFVEDQEKFVEILTDTPERAVIRGAIFETEQRLTNAREERSKIEKLFLDGLVSPDRFGELHGPLDARITEGAKQLVEQNKQLSALPPPESHLASFNRPELFKRWQQLPPISQRRLVKAFVARIVVTDDSIELAYLFGDSPDSPSKDAASPQQINTPTNQPAPTAATSDAPVYIRLPKVGKRCAHSGLTRSMLNELILPTERNNFRPPVVSKSVRKHGAVRGVRLISLESLMAHLARDQS